MHETTDPSTGEPLERYETLDADAIDRALARAERAFTDWSERPPPERARRLEALSEVLLARRDALADRMAREMGKPLAQGRSEVEKCAWAARYYAEHGERFLASEPVDEPDLKATIAHRPLGVIFAIMPWNFPCWQLMRHAAPGLMAGNVVALKHAENVPGCAADLAALFLEAGFPQGALENLCIGREAVADVIADRRVAGVTLTGSTRAGRAVASAAGAALKKTVLELGGSDPYVVLADADLDLAAEASVASRLINSGQSCIAAKRFIAVADVHDAFLERVVARMEEAKLGPARDEGVTVGPQAKRDLRDALAEQVSRSVEGGARVALGGEVPDRPGFFYPPTVLTDVRPGMAAFDEELFGPVAAVIRADDEDDAFALANRSVYGLGGAVFTRDVARGVELAARRLHTGCAAVNGFVKSDPRLPFGGVGDSGYGRELAKQGLLEWVNTKAVTRPPGS